MVRAPFYDKNGVKKGAWSKEEDAKLQAYIQKYGIWNWRELPKFAGLSRCGKSCRLRWMNYLRSDLKRGNYTRQEEDTIVKLHNEYGNKWSMIAAHLPGRTDNEIKNHWHTHLKNRGKPNPKPNNTRNSKENSEYEGIKSMESKVETNIALILPSLQIFESSPLSPETSSITHLSSSSYSVLSPDMQWVSEDFTVPSDSCAQSSGNFWTEPFVADNTYFENAYPSPLSPYEASYMDSMEMFSQLMRELE